MTISISERLAAANPDNALWQQDLFVSYTKVGEVLVAQGKLAEALKSCQDSLAILFKRQPKVKLKSGHMRRGITAPQWRMAMA